MQLLHGALLRSLWWKGDAALQQNYLGLHIVPEEAGTPDQVGQMDGGRRIHAE